MSEPRQVPRYTGIRTFAGLPHVALESLDGSAAETGEPPVGAPACVVIGAPFDTATSWRPGARFGPEAIRSASVLLRPWHAAHGIEVLDGRVLDGGDVAVVPGNAARSVERIDAALAPLCALGVVTVLLGGDHTVLLGELRAHARAHGPLALVALDAHADTWEDYYGERLFHGTVLRRAAEEGLVEPACSLIVGVRGSLYAPDDLEDARTLGFELIAIEELRAAGADFAQLVRQRTGGRPAFLSFDIDVVDPSAAPATGTPEVGGLQAAEALTLLRSLAGMRFAGFDVVEVSPPYDPPGQITALLAANVAYELLALARLAPASSAGAP